MDGFIARADGRFDFLSAGGSGDEPHGFEELFATVDALVMGRNTCEVVLPFAEWPYGAKPVFVLGHRPLPPAPAGAVVERMAGEPAEALSRLPTRDPDDTPGSQPPRPSGTMREVKVLAVSGSLREGSSNTSVLRALSALAPAGIAVRFPPPLDGLPYFNPDVEEAGPPPAVRDWRAAVALADAIAVSSPEYAHGVSGVLKNALDWLVGGVEIGGKPVAVLNARPQATIAHGALVETLRVMGARVVDQTSLPLAGRRLDPVGIAADPELTALLLSALATLQRAVDDPLGDQV